MTRKQMNNLVEELNREFVQRTPHMREIGARITAAARGRGSITWRA